MSNLKFKSDENLTAAQLLIEHKKYNSSIHCSYYGCFQYMKCMLCHNVNIGYDKQDEKRGRDTHDFIFGLLLKKMKNVTIEKRFRTNYESLKAKRKKADYANKQINQFDSLSAIEEAKSIIANLNQAFGIIKL